MAAGLAAALAGLVLVVITVAGPKGETRAAIAKSNEDNVTICHATNSASNPYSIITIDANSVDAEGHMGHVGKVPGSISEAKAMEDAHVYWGDIIPPHRAVAGLNWSGLGPGIHANNCSYSSPEETPPVTNTAAPTATGPLAPLVLTATSVVPSTTARATPFSEVLGATDQEVAPAMLPRTGEGGGSQVNAVALEIGAGLLALGLAALGMAWKGRRER